MRTKGIFVASTGQNVGKTTTCLGLLSGLKKHFTNVAFMKPVGQEERETQCGHKVDKDVVLFKEHFGLETTYAQMSPVLLPQGFTRHFLDGKIHESDLRSKIELAFQSISSQNSFTLVEGTGHTSVGSIVNMNNAQVASFLGLPIVLVASGGLGSSFDDLALNKAMCEKYRANVIGVILNRVLPDKRAMIMSYMSKALKQWDIPLLGCIPFDPFLSNPSMKDFEHLFQTPLLTGEDHRMRHFKHTRLVATSVEAYRDLILPNQLVITPATREDIISATIKKHWEIKISSSENDLEAGMILTGDEPPQHVILEEIRLANIPMLYTPVSTYAAMKMITSFTAKIRNEDTQKVNEAVDVVENHLDFDQFLDILKTY